MEAQLLEYRRKKEKEHKSKSSFLYKLFPDTSSSEKHATKANATVTEQPSDLCAVIT